MPPSEASGPAFSLKDELFNEGKTELLAGWLAEGAGIDKAAFQRDVMERLLDLELKDRIRWIADCLEAHLPDAFSDAAAAIGASLPPPLDPSLTDDDFGDFIIAPFGEFVARNGQGHFEEAMATLKELTKRFSMEDSVRTFLKLHPNDALDLMADWAKDDNYHVRRLVSEGTRPRLPWSGRLSLPQNRVMALLDQLHQDRTRYVTRSVANHLNDIAKDDPSIVISALRRWQKKGRQTKDELNWLTRHAMRTLIKAGNREALALIGFSANPPVTVDLAIETPEVTIGEALEFSLKITAAKDASLLIDYAIGFRKANGSVAPKVFKLKTLDLGKGETVTITKRHRLMGNATTYTLYPGQHDVRIQINGDPGPSAQFLLA